MWRRTPPAHLLRTTENPRSDTHVTQSEQLLNRSQSKHRNVLFCTGFCLVRYQRVNVELSGQLDVHSGRDESDFRRICSVVTSRTSLTVCSKASWELNKGCCCSKWFSTAG